ncbi:MAG TPA: acyl carrier protein [Bryobacteraceae bacterium]|jgi:acyl carrier protein
MDETQKRKKIREIVRQFASEDREPDASESLFDSGLLDSFALPQMVNALEEAFGIKIPDADLRPRQFESLDRIETYLNSRK